MITPEPQFDSVASATPTRNDGDPVTAGDTSGSGPRRRRQHARARRAADGQRAHDRGLQPPVDAGALDPGRDRPDAEREHERGAAPAPTGCGRRGGAGRAPPASRTRSPAGPTFTAKNAPPRPQVAEDARHQRADRAADAADRAPDADRDREPVVVEHRVDDRQRRREAARRRDALQRTPGDQQRVGLRSPRRWPTRPRSRRCHRAAAVGHRPGRRSGRSSTSGAANARLDTVTTALMLSAPTPRSLPDRREQHDDAVRVDRQHEHREARARRA